MNLFKIITICIIFSSAAQAQQVTVRDIGVIGLFSHDIFTWNHRSRTNEENGILDLSTIFDYDGGSRWEKGGNPKNSENAPVFSITMKLVEYYKELLDTKTASQARKQTVSYFISQVLESYTKLTGEEFRSPGLIGAANNVEQVVLRSMHDILPGWINLYRNGKTTPFKMTNVFKAKTLLNQRELDQSVRPFDGDYDPEYLKIDIVIKIINLKKIDRKFIAEFSPYNQADMLTELSAYGQGSIGFSEISFSHHLEELVQKALCSTKSEWLPERECN